MTKLTRDDISSGFIGRNNLWSDEQIEAAIEIFDGIVNEGIEHIRVGWGDQHGIVRGKTLTPRAFKSALCDGRDFQLVTTMFDTTNHPIIVPFAAENPFGVDEMVGLPDGVLVPDPTTFRTVPWAENTVSILSDAYFQNGKPVPFSTRRILRDQTEKLAADGYELIVGLECEFYIMRLEDRMLDPASSGYPPEPPKVGMLAHGFQYLTESRGDEIDEILRLLQRNVEAMGLPLDTFEDEWGPGQIEFTFSPLPAMVAADSALVFRNAVKQICRRYGYHASFMAKPVVPNIFPSGWHLHQSMRNISDGTPAFTTKGETANPLTDVGMHYLGGLLENAAGTSLLTTPTINGYKRQSADSFAPMNATWGVENRGVMLRVIGGYGTPAARIENRVGEPSANPYLYIASQIVAGRGGMNKGTDPGEPSIAGYLADKPELPKNIKEAVDAFRQSDTMRTELGDVFVNYLAAMKEFEFNRYMSELNDWEHREYFELY